MTRLRAEALRRAKARASMRRCDEDQPYDLCVPTILMDCRVIGERSDAVLRTAMPGNDKREVGPGIEASAVLSPAHSRKIKSASGK